MLLELAVRDLGVIEDLRLVMGPGLTALTGETGAGKTFVVEAIDLLVGGRADPDMVRRDAAEAVVEGRFAVPGDPEAEVILSRVVPAHGRSRAYVNGRLATIADLAEWGERLVDLHGQHAHQSLLSPAVQRAALDQFGGIDLEPLRAARAAARAIDEQLAQLGGDERMRAREIDLLRFQVEELDGAALAGADEDERLDAEESLLGDAVAHREAAEQAVAALTDDVGAADALGVALAAVTGRAPFAEQQGRLAALAAEVSDVAAELRSLAESISDDPARLADIRERRQLLHDLRRKYGDSMAEVIEFSATARQRLEELEQHDQRAAALDDQRRAAQEVIVKVGAKVAKARRTCAPRLAEAVQGHLAELGMPKAVLAVAVEGDGPADDVTMLLAANPGSPALPLAKAASGGELARAMLALRLVLTAGPDTLIFDEVDAGIGGEAAVAVGRSLSALASDQQVIVVTHLPQVAAFADQHVRVVKHSDEDHTVATVQTLVEADRVVELSRMLSGQPDSRTAGDHAEELLASAAREREAS